MFTATPEVPSYWPEEVIEFEADLLAYQEADLAATARVKELQQRMHQLRRILALRAATEGAHCRSERRQPTAEELAIDAEIEEELAEARREMDRLLSEDEPEPTPAPALTLLRNPKLDEYDPSSWMARRLSETRVELTNKSTGSVLRFVVAYGRVFGCESDASGEYHELTAGACDCPDYRHRAMKHGRHCRHSAALARLEWLLDEEKARRLAA